MMKWNILILLLALGFESFSSDTYPDSLLKSVLQMPESMNKAMALKGLCADLRKAGEENSALLYLQQGILMEMKLKIRDEILGVDSMKNEFKSGSDIEIQKIDTALSNIKLRQDTLAFAIKEFNRRTLSLQDDLIINRDREADRLAMQQNFLTQLADERARNTIWAIAGGVALTILTSLIFIQLYRRRQAKSKLELNLLQNRILRSQLNPHFIFNALNSVKKIIQKNPDAAGKYLTRFSMLMRQVLENSQEEKITLEEEISMLENYMELEALRIHSGFDYEVTFDETVDVSNTMIPPLIFQPVLENAIWHGLDPLDHRGSIRLSFIQKNDLLEATIEDNGVGMKSPSGEKLREGKRRSLGLQITRERIDLLNRKAKMKGYISQQLSDNGSKVIMGIPV